MKKLLISCLLLGLVIKGLGQAENTRAGSIDVVRYDFRLTVSNENQIIKGLANIRIRFMKPANSFDLDLISKKQDGKGMQVAGVTENGKKVTFTHDRDLLRINTFAKAGEEIEYAVSYEGVPADGLIIDRNKYGDKTFFSDNWPDRARHWLPCVDHPADKAAVSWDIIAPAHFQVIANGEMKEETNIGNDLRETRWQEDVPLPTKVMAVGIAAFAVNYPGAAENIQLSSWVYPQERENGFSDYGLAKAILPWFIKNVGPYPYKKLANVQSKTVFGGMENASAIFYHENSVKGDGRIESLLTHEIAHQWFGNSATEANWQHVWLSEGFATYMTHLFLEERYGVDSLNKRLAEDRQVVLDFGAKEQLAVVPLSVTNNFTRLLNANSYQKGGWVLHMLRRKLGDEKFWKGTRDYYAQYAGRNASTDDYRRVMETAAGMDLTGFFNQWLFRAGTPELRVTQSYDAAAKAVTMTVEQVQAELYEFPLQVEVWSGAERVMKSALVKDKITRIRIPAENGVTKWQLDPGTNLLYKLIK